MKQLKTLLFAIAMGFSVTSCLEEKPLQNDPPVNPVAFNDMRQTFIDATGGKNPADMRVGEWAYFQNYAYLYTNGQVILQGLDSAEVMSTAPGVFEYEDENGNQVSLPTKDFKIILTDYRDPEHQGDPAPVHVQKEWSCPFLGDPNYFWVADCPLQPTQNYWAFYPLLEPTEPIFYSLKKFTQVDKLPIKMINEGRCYGLPNCEINVTYLEYDLYRVVNGETIRLHYVSSYSADVPYLASNIKTCFDTLFTLEDGNKHPGKLCKELIDFRPELD